MVWFIRIDPAHGVSVLFNRKSISYRVRYALGKDIGSTYDGLSLADFLTGLEVEPQ